MSNDLGYGPIREVDASDVPPKTTSRWTPLIAEVRLRLERTSQGKSLAIPFDDSDLATFASDALRRAFVGRMGGRTILVEKRTIDGTPHIFVIPVGKRHNVKNDGAVIDE